METNNCKEGKLYEVSYPFFHRGKTINVRSIMPYDGEGFLREFSGQEGLHEITSIVPEKIVSRNGVVLPKGKIIIKRYLKPSKEFIEKSNLIKQAWRIQ